jgi:hypothetical protein
MSKFSTIFLKNVSSLEDLRRATEVAFERLITQLNSQKIDKDLNLYDHRITNVAWPVELHDVVNVEFLRNALKQVLLNAVGAAKGATTPTYDKATFGLGINSNVRVGLDTNPHYICASQGMKLVNVKAKVKTAPTGQGIVFVLKKNGTSILSTNFTIPAGSTDVQTWTAFDIITFTTDDIITVDVTQVGSGVIGQNLIIVMKFKITNSSPL